MGEGEGEREGEGCSKIRIDSSLSTCIVAVLFFH